MSNSNFIPSRRKIGLSILLLSFIPLSVAGRLSAENADSDLFRDGATYGEVVVGGSTFYLHPLWLRHSDIDAYNRRTPFSMIVKDDVIYTCDGTLTSGRNLTLSSFNAFSGERNKAMEISLESSPSVSQGPVACDCYYVSTDGHENVFLLGCVGNDRYRQDYNAEIAVMDWTDGRVARYCGITLPEFEDTDYGISSIGYPVIEGDVTSGDFQLILPITYRTNYADFVTTVCEADFVGFTQVSARDYFEDPVYHYGTADVPMPLYPYVQVLDSEHLLLDGNHTNPDIFSRDTQRWCGTLDLSSYGIDLREYSKGCEVFDFAGIRWIAGDASSRETSYVSHFHISSWDGAPYSEFGNVRNQWIVPGAGLSTKDYEIPSAAPVSLIKTVDYGNRVGENLANIYMYTPGNGMGAYQLSRKRVPTSVFTAEQTDGFQWRLTGNSLLLDIRCGEAVLYGVDGMAVAVCPPGNHELHLRPGAYILSSSGHVSKIVVR